MPPICSLTSTFTTLHYIGYGDRGGGGGGYQGGGGGAGVCYAFQKGECTRGSGCRFSHDNGGGGGTFLFPYTSANNHNRDEKSTQDIDSSLVLFRPREGNFVSPD